MLLSLMLKLPHIRFIHRGDCCKVSNAIFCFASSCWAWRIFCSPIILQFSKMISTGTYWCGSIFSFLKIRFWYLMYCTLRPLEKYCHRGCPFLLQCPSGADCSRGAMTIKIIFAKIFIHFFGKGSILGHCNVLARWFIPFITSGWILYPRLATTTSDAVNWKHLY